MSMPVLSSSEIVDRGIIPSRFTLAKGENTSPPLNWSWAPEGTQSFALTLVDPDVPWGEYGLPGPGTVPGDLFIHWVVCDLPATSDGLAAGASPGGDLPGGAVELLNTAAGFGEDSPYYQYRQGYLGMAPPAGDRAHEYIFTLFALSVGKLGLSESDSYTDFLEAVKGKVLARSSFSGYFGVKAE